MDRSEVRLSAERAAAEIDRMHGRVRRRGRWPGWLWLAMAVTTVVFIVGTGSGNWIVTDVIGPLPIVVAAIVAAVAARQHVVGREAGAIERPVAYAFLGAFVVGTVVKLAFLPDRITVWLVLLAFAVALPCGVGAWRVLRAR